MTTTQHWFHATYLLSNIFPVVFTFCYDYSTNHSCSTIEKILVPCVGFFEQIQCVIRLRLNALSHPQGKEKPKHRHFKVSFYCLSDVIVIIIVKKTIIIKKKSRGSRSNGRMCRVTRKQVSIRFITYHVYNTVTVCR